MRLALYRGPAEDWMHKLSHWAVCIFTRSPYSHCELEIHGICYSASARDGRVRGKVIDLDSGRWTVMEIGGDEQAALDWFKKNDGQPYDWAGVMRFALPFLPHRSRQWFCSEACGAALGFAYPHNLKPNTLANAYGEKE